MMIVLSILDVNTWPHATLWTWDSCRCGIWTSSNLEISHWQKIAYNGHCFHFYTKLFWKLLIPKNAKSVQDVYQIFQYGETSCPLLTPVELSGLCLKVCFRMIMYMIEKPGLHRQLNLIHANSFCTTGFTMYHEWHSGCFRLHCLEKAADHDLLLTSIIADVVIHSQCNLQNICLGTIVKHCHILSHVIFIFQKAHTCTSTFIIRIE